MLEGIDEGAAVGDKAWADEFLLRYGDQLKFISGYLMGCIVLFTGLWDIRVHLCVGASAFSNG